MHGPIVLLRLGVTLTGKEICRALGGEFERNSETTERGFFSRDRLPELYVEKNTEEQLRMCFEAHDELSAGRPWVPVVD